MIIFQFLLVIFLVLLNGFFVASEFALVAIRKTRIEELVKKGNASAKLVLQAVNNLESYISATQLGITLASLALGWIGEPAIARFLETFFSFLPHDAAFLTAHTLAVIIAFSLITFLHIVLGELAPKTIALQSAEKTSLVVIFPLMIFTRIFKPFIWILNGAGSLVLKLFGFSAPSGHQLVHSEEEIKMILAQSAEGGELDKREVEMIHKVLELGDIPTRNIMLPRTEIKAIAADITIKELKKLVRKDNLSRYPVYKGTIDTIIGYLHEKDLNNFRTDKNDMSLLESGLVRDIINVPEVQRIDDVLQAMRKRRVHLAIVNDEYGGTLGIVTLEDILENIVGEIYDEFDKTESTIRKQSDGTYIVDGLVPLQVIQQKFKVPIKGQGYITIGGVVFGLLGKEPKLGDTIQIGSLQLKVKEIEKKRIKTLILSKVNIRK
ncbi:hypothetical protein A3A46_00700 [Candidatus Roizmanbacteria bacterium RIFCSPLOWO2_01_FULL_37_13]|uniref:Hemolysin n=1 Tax=Candidatus Roizmanbacteria bacterium RIFCSPHIGHO2_02_FULL_38_11 TaxID=1802039 RepID=A0A1F7H2V7_9BACT|nr:MAG: hypothetical protein A3C25_00390 [Candidatus Roizmanbacteria bacterium RIFCSPHIGHO2_02_FULL_38_11]OGK42919.1 MAG: hypothetical protein A3A46_00700 [Candidatus Roizmanbacteria bacterium RIFCSPLOWO2_01_FULL_37_13]